MLTKIILNHKVKQFIRDFDTLQRKKVVKQSKIFLPAGGAKIAPPVSSVLGQFGISLVEFCDRFNSKTRSQNPDLILPVQVCIYANKTFNFTVKPVYIEELCFSFQIYNFIKTIKKNDTTNVNVCCDFLIVFYKLYLVFLYNHYNIKNIENVSLGVTSLKQLFGYMKSFNYA